MPRPDSVRILAFADDLTGALEVGAKFAAAGIPSLVTEQPDFCPEELQDRHGALIIDTESRHCSPTEARARVQDLACRSRSLQLRCLYHKSDSTLRGNIGCEFAGILNAYPGWPLFYSPAYPRMGRTVRQGWLYVDGRMLSATEFAHDPLNPSQQSYLPAVICNDCSLEVRVTSPQDLEATPGAIHVCDAESDADLETTARSITGEHRTCLAAGSAGLAEAIAQVVCVPRTGVPSIPEIRRCLVVNGSRHESSLGQEKFAIEHGFESLDGCSIPQGIAEPGWMILKRPQAGESPLQVAVAIGNTVREVLRRLEFDAFVVFGGDTAYAIVAALGRPSLEPLGEVLPGVPVSRIRARIEGTGRDLYLISKAGGFGPVDLVPMLFQALTIR
jgi:D-threonate/D-erythronate kinase